jgi:raffinose/stachyose/melibiose transport system permease protein
VALVEANVTDDLVQSGRAPLSSFEPSGGRSRFQNRLPRFLQTWFGPRRSYSYLTSILLLTPALALLIIFKLIPLLMSLESSLYEWSGFNDNRTFVGLNNFVRLLTKDEIFRTSLVNTAVFVLVTTIGINVICLFLAVLLDTDIRGKAFFRTVLFMPVVISMSATALLFSFVLHPYVGILNNFLRAINLETLIRPWLAERGTAMFMVSVAAIWQSIGIHLVIFIAALQTIDRELYDAAKIDGADGVDLFRRITLPLLKPFIAVSVLLTLIYGFAVFDIIYVLTRGDPYNSTHSLLSYMYERAFVAFRQGEASAIAIITMIITIVITVLHRRIFREEM